MRRLKLNRATILSFVVVTPWIPILLRTRMEDERALFVSALLAVPVPALLLLLRRVAYGWPPLPEDARELAAAEREGILVLLYCSYMGLCVGVFAYLWLLERLQLAQRIALGGVAFFLWLVGAYVLLKMPLSDGTVAWPAPEDRQ